MATKKKTTVMKKKTSSTAERKKRARRNITKAVANIHSTFNNTIITICDQEGNALAWSSSGQIGYKGSKKSTPYAAQLAGESAAEAAKVYGVKVIDVNIKGPGSGREAAVRALETAGLEIQTINDVTPVPHNGCRPPKKPRG